MISFFDVQQQGHKCKCDWTADDYNERVSDAVKVQCKCKGDSCEQIIHTWSCFYNAFNEHLIMCTMKLLTAKLIHFFN